MTIKEVEQQTGLPRSVIRFYEKEGLIAPRRNAENRYRDYTQEDAQQLMRIAFLRTLEIPLEEIGRVVRGETAVADAAAQQAGVLAEKSEALARAQQICAQLEKDAPGSFELLDVSRYTGAPEAYVQENRGALLRDCESFARWFGSDTCWLVLVLLATLVAAWIFPKLPEHIPVQWDDVGVTGTAPRAAIFGYSLVIVAIRLLLAGRIRAVSKHYFGIYGDAVSSYAVNGLCFLALCVEVFSVLYLYGAASSVDAVLLAAGVFVLALLVVAMRRFGAKN